MSRHLPTGPAFLQTLAAAGSPMQQSCSIYSPAADVPIGCNRQAASKPKPPNPPHFTGQIKSPSSWLSHHTALRLKINCEQLSNFGHPCHRGWAHQGPVSQTSRYLSTKAQRHHESVQTVPLVCLSEVGRRDCQAGHVTCPVCPTHQPVPHDGHHGRCKHTEP